MRFTAVSVLFSLLAVQQAAAGGSGSNWQCSPGYPICAKSSNQCNENQQKGINCSDESQPVSGPCTSVGGMGVQNATYGTLQCNDNRKRSLSPRGGSSTGLTDKKVIKQTCGTEPGSGLTINKGSGQKYSCNAHHILVEQPTVVQVTHYNHQTGQQCSYHQLCNANEVTTIKNEFCCESDSHEYYIHPSSPSGPNGTIGLVRMDYGCTPGPSSSCSVPPASSSSAMTSYSAPSVIPSRPVTRPVSPPLSTAPTVSPPVTSSASSPSESGTTSYSTSSPIVSPSSYPSLSVTPSSTSSPVVSPSSNSSSSVTPSSTSPPIVSLSSTSSPIESGTTSPSVTLSTPPTESTTSTTSVPVETEYTSLTTYTTVTSCPVTSTTVVSGSTSIVVNTTVITSTITTCHRCAEKTSSSSPIEQASSIPSPSSSSPSVPLPPAPTTSTSVSQETGTTSSAPSPIVYTSTPVVLTTTTEIVLTTVTTCPVTTTIFPSNQKPTVVTTSTVSTVTSTSISTITTTTFSPPSSSPIPVVPAQSPSSSPIPVVPAQSSSSSPIPVVPAQSPSSSPIPVVPAQSLSSSPFPVVPVQSPSSSSSSLLPPSQPSPPPAFQGCVSALYDLKGCGSNTDYDCYCKQDEVTTKVYECITNYEQDVALQAQAMASYQGLCAQHIPQHPAIITKSVELIPTPVSTPAGSSPALSPAGTVTPAPSPLEVGQTTTTTAPAPGNPAPTSAPSSSISSTTVSVTVTVPCSAATGLVNQITDGQLQVSATESMAPGCTTTSLLSVAVAPMHFVTAGNSVGLAAGTPAANEAGATSTASPALLVPGVAGASGNVSVPASSATLSPTAAAFTGAAARTSHSGIFLSVVLAAIGLVVYA